MSLVVTKTEAIVQLSNKYWSTTFYLAGGRNSHRQDINGGGGGGGGGDNVRGLGNDSSILINNRDETQKCATIAQGMGQMGGTRLLLVCID